MSQTRVKRWFNWARNSITYFFWKTNWCD